MDENAEKSALQQLLDAFNEESVKSDLNEDRVSFLNITLKPSTIKGYNEWVVQCMADAVSKQRAETDNPSPRHISLWDSGLPYDGTIGGGISITITPTRLGDIVKARYPYLDREFDLSEFEDW